MESILPGLQSAVNLHPMVVHFPIAFWAAATVLWSLAVLKHSEELWKFGLWLHTAGALTGLLAVAFGYLGTSIMGHSAPGHDLVHVHRDIMKVAAILSVLLTCAAWLRRASAKRSKTLQYIFLGISVVQAITMTIGADRGAVLVYQNGTGVKITPHVNSASGDVAPTNHQH